MKAVCDILLTDSPTLSVSPSLPIPRSVLDLYDQGRLSARRSDDLEDVPEAFRQSIHFLAGYRFEELKKNARDKDAEIDDEPEARTVRCLVTRTVTLKNETDCPICEDQQPRASGAEK